MITRLHALRRSLVPAALATAALVFGSACSPAPMPISQSSRDPSSPLAPEGASPLAAAHASPAPAAAKSGGHEHDSHEHDHHGHHGHAHGQGHDHAEPASAGAHDGHGPGAGADGGTQGTVYVCPMHPEVTSTTPGALCPKCNMKLEPKK